MPQSSNNRNYLYLTSSFIFLSLFVAITSCSSVDVIPPQEDRPTIEAAGLELTRHDETGNVTLRIISTEAEYYDGVQTGNARDVQLWFYNSAGEQTLYLEADEMDYNFDSGMDIFHLF